MRGVRDSGLFPSSLVVGPGRGGTFCRRTESGEKMADWNAIRSEYITSSASQRELARKYGVSQASINRRSRSEKWDESRESFRSELIQKTTKAVCDSHIDRITRLLQKGDRLEQLLSKLMNEAEATGDIRAADIKTIASALKDLRDLYRAESGGEEDKYRKVRDLLGGIPDALE